MDEDAPVPVRGRPKSGRVWKSVQLAKHSALKRDKPLHSSWVKKRIQKDERAAVKALESELKAQRDRENEEKRVARVEREKRKLENARRAEVVQPIRNLAKLKRMRKKQLRKIEKRDTS